MDSFILRIQLRHLPILPVRLLKLPHGHPSSLAMNDPAQCSRGEAASGRVPPPPLDSSTQTL